MATAATIQTQEKNRKYASVAHALDAARDWLATVTGQLSIARREKKTLRIIELEPEVAQASEALDKAAREYKSLTGVEVSLSTEPQLRPGSVNSLRAANSEFRRLDDEVARLERERHRVLTQIVPLKTTLEKERATFSFTTTSNPAVDAVLSQIYPDIRPNIGPAFRDQRIVRMSIELADLEEKFRKTEAERLAATAARDAMLEQLRVAR